MTACNKKTPILLLPFIVLGVLCSMSAVAGDNVWTFDGAEGGSTGVVGLSSLDPTFRLASSSRSVYRWDTQSQSWVAVTDIPGSVDDVLFSPTNGAMAHTIDFDWGVYRTSDAGVSFEPVNEGLPSTGARSIARGADGRLYVGFFKFGIFASDDEGDTWTAASDGLPVDLAGAGLGYGTPLAIGAGPTQRVYVALALGQVHASDDGGTSWYRPVNAGLPNILSDYSDFIVNPNDADHVILSGRLTHASFDGGDSWEVMSLPDITSMRPVDGVSGRYYAGSPTGGIYRSDDFGQSWSEEALLGQSIFDLAVAASGEGVGAGSGGLSFRHGLTGEWATQNTGFVATTALRLQQAGPSERVYAATFSSGVLTSADRAQSWQRAGGGIDDFGGLPIRRIEALAVTPANDEVLYASAFPSLSLYQSTDAGQSWQAIAEFDEAGGYLSELAVAPDNAARLYAGTLTGTVWRSDDEGRTWLDVTPDGLESSVREMAVSPADGDVIVIGSLSSGLFYSANAGVDWTRPLDGEQAFAAISLRFSSSRPNEVHVIGNRDLFRSVDAGQTWWAVEPAPFASLIEFHVHPRDADVYFASTFSGRVQRSLDAGLTWEAIGQGLNVVPTPLLVADAMDTQLYGGQFASGFGAYTLRRDASIAMTTDTSQITLADAVSVQWRVQNDATGYSGRVRVQIPAPGNARITSVSSTVGACDLEAGEATCVLAAMAPESSWDIVAELTPVWFGAVTLSANVSSIEQDLTPSDNATQNTSIEVISADLDDDGVSDVDDNCLFVANPDQRDSNSDGYGNRCDADLNNDLIVGSADLGLLRIAFFSSDANADFNGDGQVNAVDLGIMRTLFFRPPGPSGQVGPESD